MENAIIEWINNPNKNYEEGIALFSANGGNKFMLRYFQATKPRFALSKLIYELGKLAKKPVVISVKTQVQKSESGHSEEPPVAEGFSQTEKDVDETGQSDDIPETAKVAKRIVHDTWVELSRIKNELYDLGTENTPELMEKRAALLKEQADLSERYNKVYEAKEMFFDGEIDEKQLLDIINYKEESKEPAKVDLKGMSDLELSKAIKAAKQYITRCTNQLLYQRDTSKVDGKQAKENPMPDCPKKESIIAKMGAKKVELVNLEAELQSRGDS